MPASGGGAAAISVADCRGKGTPGRGRPWAMAAPGVADGCLPALVGALALLFGCQGSLADASNSPALYPKPVEHVLTTYCFDCHGDGMEKGKVALDQFDSREQMLARRDLWMAALKNLRAGIMPPQKKPRPSPAEQQVFEYWVKTEMFQLDLHNPDPGRVTLRRLNRVEYRNTIKDLMGYDFNVDEELPPDDTGYGFDTIGDVLTMSPLLLEKYMRAAEQITADAVPRTLAVPSEETISGEGFRAASGGTTGRRLDFYQESRLARDYSARASGTYRLTLELQVQGQFEFDPGQCLVLFKSDDHELWRNEFKWQNGKQFEFRFDQKWDAGPHHLVFELHPKTPPDQKHNALDLRIQQVRVTGPLEPQYLKKPRNFDRFFWKDPPAARGELRAYAREVLARFAGKAYRRPVDHRTLDRLAAIAEDVYTSPGKCFADGIAEAMVPVLASPRFLFRVEQTEPQSQAAKYPLLDEYSLASRLSYFLWSTMPDDELLGLASRHELRKNLAAQIKRMVEDRRSQALVENFVGQWLQVRDLDGININEQAVLARDRGEDRERERRIHRFQELNAIPADKRTPEQLQELDKLLADRRRRAKARNEVELNHELRRAMGEETQMDFAYVMRENRSTLDLVSSDYTFLNQRLAQHYGMTNIAGNEMRRVILPPDSPRGGVLTDGSVLIVTSNPTRTSPVKRGLFILDNILGMPPPPPPANIPPLEASEKDTPGHEPTLRETLAIHRSQPLCSSCHNRMDPLGLSLENFNALGMWRDEERGTPIDAAGQLITGEPFTDIRQVKEALVTRHRRDFYRCLTEKLMTYAIGRGLEYYDVETVDHIVDQLDQDGGRFSTLLAGVIDSAPFQRTRNPSPTMAGDSRNSKTVIR